MSDIVRVLRVLEYVGERKWVEKTLAQGAVAMTWQYEVPGKGVIKSAIIDPFPEVVRKEVLDVG